MKSTCMTLSLICFPNDGIYNEEKGEIQGEQSKCVGNTACLLSSLSCVLKKKKKMGIATRGI